MTAALAVCRFAHFLTAIIAFGACAYLRVCAPARLRAALAPAVWPAVRAAALVSLAAAIARLPLEAAAMANEDAAMVDPATLESVLTDTAFGRAWAVVLILGAALALAVVFRRAGSGIAAGLAGLSLASLALVGHAAMQGGAWGVLHRANDAAHLIAAGGWIGALPLFILSLRASSMIDLAHDAVAAMMRFSTSGHVVVAAVVVTGTFNVGLTVGLPWPPSTPYRLLLDLKIGIVAVMIGLAVVNRYVLVPRLAKNAASHGALRSLTLVNVGLGTAVVALVSAFGLLDPA